MTDHDTFFADVDFFPHDVSWDIATGYMHRFGVGTYLGYRYEWTEPQQTAFYGRNSGRTGISGGTMNCRRRRTVFLSGIVFRIISVWS